jgi:hypothetical protein
MNYLIFCVGYINPLLGISKLDIMKKSSWWFADESTDSALLSDVPLQ